ncbi:hypothetical protein [Methanosarcina vacuolata]|nr:hypothetical protein [Methanosarcina vacuolata]
MGDKHRIKLILNYRKRVGKNCRSTDRIFLGNVQQRLERIKDLPKDG